MVKIKKTAKLKSRKQWLKSKPLPKVKSCSRLSVPERKIPLAYVPALEGIQVEEAKFHGPQDTRRCHSIDQQRLPEKYNRDVIVLQVRDPWWLYAWWEVKSDTYVKIRERLKELFASAIRVLRVYDVSYINFNGHNAHRFFDIEVYEYSNNWYIDTAGPGRSWCVDFGLKLRDGTFITILRSNVVTTPLDGPSWITDEEWAVAEDLFSKLYGNAIGLGGSPVRLKKPWLLLQKRLSASGGVSSFGASPVKQKLAKKPFWLQVNTELIVYGQTEADAKVSISGLPIKLCPDGSFSVRFALPDGYKSIPVKAVSSDSLHEKTITPEVTKKTK